eukprot:473262-Pyramimonas_sp.AAC.1
MVQVAILSPAPTEPPILSSEPRPQKPGRPPDERGPWPGTASADQPAADVSASGAGVKPRLKVEVRSPAGSVAGSEKQ